MNCERCGEDRELTHAVNSDEMKTLRVCAECAAFAERFAGNGPGQLTIRPLPAPIRAAS